MLIFKKKVYLQIPLQKHKKESHVHFFNVNFHFQNAHHNQKKILVILDGYQSIPIKNHKKK